MATKNLKLQSESPRNMGKYKALTYRNLNLFSPQLQNVEEDFSFEKRNFPAYFRALVFHCSEHDSHLLNSFFCIFFVVV